MTTKSSNNNNGSANDTNQTEKSNTIASESVEVRHQSDCVFHLYGYTIARDRVLWEFSVPVHRLAQFVFNLDLKCSKLYREQVQTFLV